MKLAFLLTTIALLFLLSLSSFSQSNNDMPNYGIVIHGGAGGKKVEPLDPDLQKIYLKRLEQALQAGYSILDTGGSALDAQRIDGHFK